MRRAIHPACAGEKRTRREQNRSSQVPSVNTGGPDAQPIRDSALLPVSCCASEHKKEKSPLASVISSALDAPLSITFLLHTRAQGVRLCGLAPREPVLVLRWVKTLQKRRE
ncbi:hypothetical protein NHX12_012881 [Muraenolepis orangiensis]|uniref:Uncharacterized protein n=1 Tax=Muraenolepis orangiensis TaxID=630683 RepID=A0A9Q0I6B9_9TELE|nr:hypothetical protein NHX12_012881 [Muraenolepis orangiensis]